MYNYVTDVEIDDHGVFWKKTGEGREPFALSPMLDQEMTCLCGVSILGSSISSSDNFHSI